MSSGWMSTSRNSNTNKSDVVDDSTERMTRTETLPLDWTRVKRKRNNNDNNGDDEECCNDPEFYRHNNKRLSFTSSSSSSSTLVVSNSNIEQIQKGHAIFCLHDVNPGWFQGYYFVSSSSWSSSSS